MANVLRDFFILEFAIYNFGNVTKQFRWIAGGLSEINSEFEAIERRLEKIEKLSSVVAETEKVLKGLGVMHLADEQLPENIREMRREYENAKQQIFDASKELEQFNVKAYATNKILTNIAALIATKFGALSLVFKTYLDNFVRLEREAISLSEALGVAESTAFGIAKAFENIGLSAQQYANAITSFQRRFFTDMRLPMLLTRFGVDPARIFSGNIISFINEISKVAQHMRKIPPFFRAYIAETLGKDLYDMTLILNKYNIADLIKKYLLVFSPEVIERTRATIIRLQLTIAEFWVTMIPFVESFTKVVSSITSFVRKLLELFNNVPLLKFIGNLVTLFTSISSLGIGLVYARRLFVSSVGVFVSVFSVLKYLFYENAIAARIFGKSVQDATASMGMARVLTQGLGLSTLFTSGFATIFTAVLGITGLLYLFGGGKNVAQEVKDNTAEIANNTRLTNMYLFSLASDIRQLVKVTALGGTLPPLYQIINMQTALNYALTTNTSVM